MSAAMPTQLTDDDGGRGCVERRADAQAQRSGQRDVALGLACLLGAVGNHVKADLLPSFKG
jgi:hypothetical protein